MDRTYQPLTVRALGANAGFRRPSAPAAARVTLESPALDVMTDLERVAPAIIRPQAPLAAANRFMITRGVRLLLIVDDDEIVLGLLTATDVLGERPMRVATERGLRRDELSAADVMTPASQVEAIEWGELAGAHVGHVLATLRRSGRQHALVVDDELLAPPRPLAPPARRAMVRGIFSLSQIARQLGVAVQPGAEIARTFAEIESAIR